MEGGERWGSLHRTEAPLSSLQLEEAHGASGVLCPPASMLAGGLRVLGLCGGVGSRAEQVLG